MCYRIKQIGIEEANVESVDKYRIPADQVSPEIAAKFQPLMRSLAALEFIVPAWYVFEDDVNGGMGCQVVLRHQSRVALARLWRHVPADASEPGEPIALSFLSALNDGTFLVSTASHLETTAPAAVLINPLPDASAEQLWGAHRRAIAADSAKRAVVAATEPDGEAIRV